MKFAISLTKGNNRKILEVCDTRNEAMEKGEKHRKLLTMDSGVLSCISADYDGNGNIIDGKYNLNTDVPRLYRRRVPFQNFSGGYNPPLKF